MIHSRTLLNKIFDENLAQEYVIVYMLSIYIILKNSLISSIQLPTVSSYAEKFHAVMLQLTHHKRSLEQRKITSNILDERLFFISYFALHLL